MIRPHDAAANWPLIGRNEELAFIAEAFEREEPLGLVIAGAAGVGKTRLAAEALRAAEAAGYATASAAATESAASIPFGALAPLLPEPDARARRPIDVLVRAGRALTERADGRQLALTVDDAHLLDDASATLLHQLAAGRKAVVVVTIRTGERAPDPVVALWKERLCEYLELQPLTRDEVAYLVRQVLGGDVDDSTLHGLWSATRGNVLFLRELVVGGLEQGALAERDGLWRWAGPLATSTRLLELIEARLGRLEADERELLETVALGEPLEANIVERLGPTHTLETIERRGLLEMQRDGRRSHYRLSHPLYGEALRLRTPPVRVRSIQERLANALEATGARRREDLMRLATWRLESGGAAAPAVLLEAARQAQAAFDGALAERLARAAAASGGGFPAEHTLARALLRQGRFREADDLFARLEDEAVGRERAIVAEARAKNLAWGLGRPAEAEEVLARVEQALAQPQGDRLTALRAWLLCFRGRPDDALAALEPLLGREVATGSLEVRVAIAAVNALALAGRADEAVALADRSRPAALRAAVERPFLAIQLESVRFLALWLTGRYAQAAELVEPRYEALVRRGTPEATAAFAVGRGAVALGEGRIRSALRWLREGALLFREFDPVGFLPWTLALLAQALGQAGDARGAEAVAAEAEAARRPGMDVCETDLALGRAWMLAAGGELARARHHAAKAAESAEARGQRAFAVIALHELARLGDPEAAAPRLASLVGQVDGPLAPACAVHASGLVADDPVMLEQAAGEFEATGARLRAAEAASAAAAAYRRAGREASARAASARAATLAEACEGARTPGLAAGSPLDELTDREREVTSLAIAGLSNGQIAERLVVSIRTVENHLQHAYHKLGVTSRRQLAPLLERSTRLQPPLRRM